MKVDNLGEILRAREDELSAIYENVPGILFYIAVEPGGEFRFLSVSRDFLVATGLTREQIEGSLVRDIIPPPSRDMVLNHYRQAILSRQTVRWEEESVYPAGRRYGEVAVTPLYDAHGVATHLIGIVHDITERRTGEHRLRLVLDATGGGSWTWDSSTNRIDWDERFRTLYGFNPEEPPALNAWLCRIHQEDRCHMIGLLGEILHSKTRDSWDTTLRIVRPDGTMLWIESRGRAEHDAEGYVTRLTGFELDVSERRCTELSLHRTETRLRVFLENSPTIAWLKDDQGRHVFHSPTYEKQFPMPPVDWQGKTDFDLWPKEVAEQFQQADRAVLELNEPLEVLESKPGPDGTISWWLNKKFWFRDESGQRYIGGISLDITDRRRAEETLRQSEERFRLAAEAAGFGTFDYDVSRRTNSFSPEVWNILGVPRTGDSRDIDVLQFIHPDDGEPFKKMMTESLNRSGPEHQDAEFRIVRPDGQVRWIHAVSRRFFEGEGEFRRAVRVVGTLLDVTDRVRLTQHLEVALQRTDSELRTIVKAAPIGIVTTDHEGKVTTWNDAAEKIFGYRADEVLGRIDLTVPYDALGGFRESLSRALEGATVQSKGQRIRKDRSLIHVSLVHAPLRDELGASTGIITLVEDITEKMNTQNALARARLALAEARVEEARRIARDLHDDISQRLALLSLEIDRMASGPPRSHEDMVVSFRSFGDRISDVCAGLREISHRMHPSAVEHLGLPTALKYLCDDFSKREGVSVKFQSGGVRNDIPISIGSCLYRIAQEALRNISKHAKAFYVDVALAISGQAIQLSIIDSGAGFHISAVNRGIGLHSMRERAELLNGSFSIVSEPGFGTGIVVSVPLHEVFSVQPSADGNEAIRPNECVERQTKRCRLVIGDDHPVFAAGVAKILEDTCEIVATVGDGLALVQAAKQLNPDLVLLDISMPIMNGFDAARQIRMSVPSTKLLFLTTHSDAIYADEAFKAGANGYLVKQAALSELPKAIAAVLDGDTYRSAAIAAAGGTP